MTKGLLSKGGKRGLMLVTFLLMAVATFAVPAKPGLTRQLTLTDGSTVNATLVGDEFLHYWLGEDGKAYQAVSKQERGSKGGSEEGNDVYQAFDLEPAKKSADERRNSANQQRARRLAPKKVGSVGSITGQKKGIIILVNFTDKTFTATQSDFYNLANTVNYNSGNFKGSMHDYFYAQSDGQFELTFDVVGPYTVSQDCSYYGQNNNNNRGDDAHPAEMIIEAVKKADNDVNFANYDWDSDGYVDQVYVVYAGKGEADGGAANTIWPHEWTLSSAKYYNDGSGPQTLDGVTINTYACGGEQNGSTGETAGIGTMCHEFSHCLGYPDFYDTDYSGGQGMGYWDLMNSGSYNGDGYQPAGYTSYERWVAGWKTPEELLYTQNISNMKALQDNGSKTYIIYNKGHRDEYYLLENRQKTGWDTSLPGAGLLILHVDYNLSVWNNNKPNDDPSHQRMTWIAADNEYQYTESNGDKYYTWAGMKNDPFPYGSVNAFGKNTTPAATLYNKNSDNSYYLDSSVENITQNSDGTVSFYFNGIEPTIIVTEESLSFNTPIGTPQTKQIELMSEALTEDITVTLSDANNVFSIDKTSVSKADSEEGATVDVTFQTATVGTYTATITLSSVGAEDVTVSLTGTAAIASPTGLELSEVGSTSMTASWSAVDGAESYEIDVVQGSSFETSVGVTVLEEDFSDTTGWTLSGTGTYTGSGLYGQSSPSIKFDGTNDYAISPEFGSGTKLQFWAYGNNGNGSTFKISGLVNGSWQDIETVVIAQGGATYEVNLPNGTSQVRFDFTKSVNCALDDVKVYGPGSSPVSVDGYPKSVGNVTSYAVTGLTSGTQYAVRVRAVNSGSNSDWSATATATTTSAEASSANEFALVTSTSADNFVEGDYIIVYNNGAMKASVSSNRLDYKDITPTNKSITTDDATIIWHIAPSGNYYTIYNAGVNKFAASTGTKNQAQLLTSGTDDKSLWSVTKGTTFDFTNKHNSANNVNATLRRNDTYGFACYASGTGGALSLYKRTSGSTPTDPAIAYYQNADGKKGSELKTAMSGIILPHTQKTYDYLWTAFQTTDVRNDGKIWDMYSNATNYEPANKGETYTKEGDCYNREHSFPKSWFGGEVTPMFTDLHHIYPTDGYINGRRSNYPFGETNGGTYQSANNFSKLGTCTYPGYTGIVFEPADEYKGDFARTYFYMVTCYENELSTWRTNYSSTEVQYVLDGSTYPGLTEWQLNMLMKWAKNDPVSEKETARNNAVYAIQNNRNPFIDYPGLEEYVWGSLTAKAFSYDNYEQPTYKQDVAMSFSPVEATANVGEDFTEPTLTTNPAGLTVTYSSSDPSVATVNSSTGEVALVAAGTTTITASFAGNDSYNEGSASYTLTVSNPALAFGETLLYEGLSKYSGSDASQAMETTYQYLDYKGWSSITSVFAGGKSNAQRNGGCLKFGSGSAAGSMTTSSITLTNGGTLTFYLKKYSSDEGKLKVTVEGYTEEEFTPTSDWTLCTVELSEVSGNVTITLATTKNRAYVDEIKLTSNGTLNLANDGGNATNIAAAAANGGKFNVKLKDRTLYEDGNWNTLCLPFDCDLLSIMDFGLTVMAFDADNSTFDNGTLTLNFTTVYDGIDNNGTLVAGTPYIVKWPGYEGHTAIIEPVFYGVTINAIANNTVCDLGDGKSIAFCGTYEQLTYDAADQSVLFLGSENKLYYPESGARIGAQRAYFKLNGFEAKASAPGNGGAPVRQFVLNFNTGDNESQGIKAIDNGQLTIDNEAGAWYTLDGMKQNGKPTQKGLYIHNGRKVVIK